MPKLFVDNKPYDISKGKNVLEACLSLGYDLPYFCWHPAMDSVGACRQCAVTQYEKKEDEQGKIVMSCMTPVEDDTYISIEDEQSKNFRKKVIEWLMINHPHDCPTCDEGGECHLQDMTVMTGHNYRRYRFRKRTFRNQDLGPCINHEMNRCIHCYRCVRFYRDYAGGDDLNAFAAHNHVYFGRHEDGTLESPFSGNLVEVCPTGVFTDKTLKKHYTRKWDLTNAPSICQQCSLGCNIIPGERYGTLRRIQSRYNGEVNGYFICDRGRFGYEFVNSVYRIRHAMEHDPINDTKTHLNVKDALDKIADEFKTNKKVIGIGSPRASLESNYALRKMVGKEHFYAGMSRNELQLTKSIYEILKTGPARTPSLRECENADAVLILGEDLTHTAPMLSLAIRQTTKEVFREHASQKEIPDWQDLAVRNAAQNEDIPIYSLSPSANEIEDIATHLSLHPNQIIDCATSIAHKIDPAAPTQNGAAVKHEKEIQEIVEALKEADNPLIISGTSLQNPTLIRCAANIANALCNSDKQAWLSYVVPDANSLGLAMMEPLSINDLLSEVNQHTLILNLENDLFRFLSEENANRIIEPTDTFVSLDHTINRTTEAAQMVLPVGSFAESDGTLVNNEGRAQRFYQVMQAKGDEKESWKILDELERLIHDRVQEETHNLDDFTYALAEDIPVFSGIKNISPPAGFLKNGQKIPRQPQRYSGRTAMNAHKNVSEQPPPEDPDSALAFSMEGYKGQPPSSLIPNFWSPGWNSQQAINKYQIEVGGHLHNGDPGIRLLEPQAQEKNFYELPDPFPNEENELIVLPSHHIFGSEYYSMQSPAINERAPDPRFKIHKKEAHKYGIQDNQSIKLTIAQNEVELNVQVLENWPEGVIGYPLGFPGVPYIDLPAETFMKPRES